MKKTISMLVLIIFFYNCGVYSRDIGQTEITAEEGIEVFQIEKYYLLKKNVEIKSDNFNLVADRVKAYFDKDLYDVVKIESYGDAILTSNEGIIIKGININFFIKDEIIEVFGENSLVNNGDIKMLSNEYIKINNLNGNFKINGKDSELITKDVYIKGEFIDGKYLSVNGINEVQELIAKDSLEANFRTKEIDMYALKAVYNKENNIIKLFDKVKVIRGGETIIGDYATVNTLDKSYKVKSENKNKVKILIENTDE